VNSRRSWLLLVLSLAALTVAGCSVSSEADPAGGSDPIDTPDPSATDAGDGDGDGGGTRDGGADPKPVPVVGIWTRAVLGDGITRIISVHGTSKDDVWVLAAQDGKTQTFHFDGAGWTPVGELPGPGVRVFALSKTEVWAITTTNGRAWRWSGAAWESKGNFNVTTAHALWASSGSDVWFGSQSNFGGETATRRWDGSAWSPRDTGSDFSVTSLWGSGPQDIWAANGGLLRYAGTSWTSVTAPTGGKTVRAVAGSDKDAVFAVGNGGLALHWDGSAWKAFDTKTTQDLSQVWAHAKDEVWAAGEMSSLVRWDGASWARAREAEIEDSQIPGAAQTIWGTSAVDLWVGRGSNLYHRVPAADLTGCEVLADTVCGDVPGKPAYVRCMAAATPAAECVKSPRAFSGPPRTAWCCPDPLGS
jgi:hypothetical protein